jgi:hypothetical protein
MQQKSKIFTVGLAVIVLIVIYGSFKLYKSTYGKVEINLALAGTDIILDNSKKISSKEDTEKLEIPLSPKKHEVIISRTGYLPWQKKFLIERKEKIVLNPILIPQNTTGELITVNDPHYWEIRKMVERSSLPANLPSKNKPKISQDKSTSIWVEENVIIAKNGENIYTVIAPEEDITAVEFYKSRGDAVIFSAGTGVYVIETKKDTDVGEKVEDNIQNIFPIYKGHNPKFIETDPNYIYILDGDNLMTVVI